MDRITSFAIHWPDIALISDLCCWKGHSYRLSPIHKILQNSEARRGGVEVAGWTVDRMTRVRFPAYPHRVWALWWQGGRRRLRTSRYPCRGGLGTLKTPSCPWCWVLGSRSKFRNWTTVPSLYIWNIAENDVKPQQTKIREVPMEHLKRCTPVTQPCRIWYLIHALSNYTMFPLVLLPLLLIWGSVLLYARSQKGGCCSISND